MSTRSTLWFSMVRAKQKARVSFDFADLAVRVTWPDGFSYLARSPSRDFMDYEYLQATIRRARDNYLRRKRYLSRMTPEEKHLADEQLIDAFIAAGKMKKCPTVYLDVSTGSGGNYIAPDTTEFDPGIAKRMSLKARGGWRRRRMWKQGVQPK